VLPEEIEVLRVREWRGDLVHRALRIVEPPEHGVELRPARIFLELQLDLLEARVPAEYARTDPPAVERRHRAAERHQHGDDGHQDHPEAVDQVRRPERQVALQEGDARLEVAPRLRAERESGLARRGKLAEAGEHARRSVDLARGAQQEVRERRVQCVAGEQIRRGRKQRHVALRHVRRQIEDAVREHELREIGEPAHVRVGAREADQVDPRGRGELLDRRRFRGRDEEHCVELAALELLEGGFALDRQQLGRRLFRAGGAEQRERERAGAALRSAHGDAAPLQLPDVLDRIAPVEDPERDVGEASEGHDVRAALSGVDAALHERDVGSLVGEELHVGQRAAGLPHFQRDAVLLENLLVAPRVVARPALVGRHRHRDLPGRRGLDEEHRDAERRGDDEHRGGERDPQVPAEDAARLRPERLASHGGRAVYAWLRKGAPE
jgi:hypothetical protein